MNNYSIIKNAITKDDIANILDYFYENRIIETVRVGFSFEPLTHLMNIFNNGESLHPDDIKKLDKRLECLLSVLELCKNHFLENYEIKYDFQYRRGFLNMMEAGTHLPPHSDDTDVYVGRRENEFNYSGVLFLNDDYEGGQLYFPKLQKNFKLEAGDLILFKGSVIHGVRRVKSGSRINFVIFFKDSDVNSKILINEETAKKLEEENKNLHEKYKIKYD